MAFAKRDKRWEYEAAHLWEYKFPGTPLPLLCDRPDSEHERAWWRPDSFLRCDECEEVAEQIERIAYPVRK